MACIVRNAANLLQVVNFTCLLHLVNKLQQICHFHQDARSLYILVMADEKELKNLACYIPFFTFLIIDAH